MISEPGVDIEVTNRCNAKCHFCPRDATPHQGLMSPEVFEQTLRRTAELRSVLRDRLDLSLDRVSLCGLGEPLLNRHVIEWTARVTEEGFTATMSSNGALLDERRATALLDAGLRQALINVGDVDADYEAVYGLPFEKTRDNVARFVEMARGRCEVSVVLVDHRRDPEHLARMRSFWTGHGVDKFVQFDVMNRGGALFVDHMQYETFPERSRARQLLDGSGDPPVCATPFSGPFVGYDGNYYLCCSDWKKEVPLGSVFDRSFTDILADKLDHVFRRATVCRTCNLDPLNQFTDQLRALDVEAGGAAERELLASYVDTHHVVLGLLERVQPGVVEEARGKVAAAESDDSRRFIPVSPARG